MVAKAEIIERLKSAYAEWNRSKGDNKDMWFDVLADGIDFRSLGHAHAGIPWAVNCSSPEQVRGYLDGLTDAFKMDHYTVERFVCDGDTVVVICDTAWTNRATGKQAWTPKVDVWRFNDEGRAVAYHEYYDTAGVLQAALT
jgi:ketosteroid isomerase-like protein